MPCALIYLAVSMRTRAIQPRMLGISTQAAATRAPAGTSIPPLNGQYGQSSHAQSIACAGNDHSNNGALPASGDAARGLCAGGTAWPAVRPRPRCGKGFCEPSAAGPAGLGKCYMFAAQWYRSMTGDSDRPMRYAAVVIIVLVLAALLVPLSVRAGLSRLLRYKQTYLLVLQDNSELRNTGGILAFMGSVDIQNGEPTEFEACMPTTPTPPARIATPMTPTPTARTAQSSHLTVRKALRFFTTRSTCDSGT